MDRVELGDWIEKEARNSGISVEHFKFYDVEIFNENEWIRI